MSNAVQGVHESYLNRKQILQLLKRHETVNQQRLLRARDVLTYEQSSFLTLLPLLLHINHPSLPGFINTDTPAGIAAYSPDRDALLLAKRYTRSLKSQQRIARQPPIMGLYLIGSIGSIGQDNKSDLDIWLCFNDQLSEKDRSALANKVNLLEAYANEIKLAVHFFSMNAEEFRDGKNLQISNESSGDTQHNLLLEEFYRTAIKLAGKPPLWWAVPPEHSNNYTAYCKRLIDSRFIDEKDWLDFGGLNEIANYEFFTAAHWQLFKGIDSPYKSLLKLILFEAYADQFPNIQWLSGDVKKIMHASDEIDADKLDPYLLLMQRIEKYLAKQEDLNRLNLARRAFYFKSNVKLSRPPSSNWHYQQMSALAKQWGWKQGEFLILDSRAEWKLERTLEERNQLVAELNHSYQQLTTFASQQGNFEGINNSELALLGRKLYATLERHPGKVDCANPGISQNLSENEIWLRQDTKQDIWNLYLSPPNKESVAIKSANSLLEMLTWLHTNAVVNSGTRIDVSVKSIIEPEHQRILKILQKQLVNKCTNTVALSNFNYPPQGKLSIAFINSGKAEEIESTALTISKRSDPLSFGAQHENLISNIEHLSYDSWGELRVKHHKDKNAVLNMLCAHLNLFWNTSNAVPIQCHCFNSIHANAIASRLLELTTDINGWFQQQGAQARYLLCIANEFYLINRFRQQFDYIQIGDQASMHDYLMQSVDSYKPLRMDKKSLLDSPFAFLVNQNKVDQIQIFYRVKRNGIQLYVLDDIGVLYQQWLPQAQEQHFLIQQQRFFDTLQTWGNLAVTEHIEAKQKPINFYRLHYQTGQWHTETVTTPRTQNKHYLELTLTTGQHGPWKDGFSLISGSYEFNSLQLGNKLYREVTNHLLNMRRNRETYPIYLTGVVATNSQAGIPIPLVELLRFKGAIEKRLAQAMHSQ